MLFLFQLRSKDSQGTCLCTERRSILFHIQKNFFVSLFFWSNINIFLTFLQKKSRKEQKKKYVCKDLLFIVLQNKTVIYILTVTLVNMACF